MYIYSRELVLLFRGLFAAVLRKWTLTHAYCYEPKLDEKIRLALLVIPGVSCIFIFLF